MRKGLRKISQLAFRDWIVFLRQKAEVVSQTEQSLEKVARFLFSADAMQTGCQPERARQKHPFSSGQPIHTFFFGSIAKHETVSHQLAFDRFNRPAHSLVGKWQESRAQHPEQARVESIRSVILGKGFLFPTESARANLRMDLIANLPPPIDISSRTSALFHQFNRAIKSHPCHHFGMGEMFAAAAHFPNSLVRFVPI